MPPRCNQLAQAKTGTVPFRCALPGARLAAHLWLSACTGVCEERRCTRGEPDGAATQVDLKPSAPPASPPARQRAATRIPSGRRPAPVTGWPGGSPAVHRSNERVEAASRGEALPMGCRNSKKTPLQATSPPPTMGMERLDWSHRDGPQSEALRTASGLCSGFPRCSHLSHDDTRLAHAQQALNTRRNPI